ncbi:MAG: sugar phosphate isomerase/epimerase family protein [Phycisphaerae bacterium]
MITISAFADEIADDLKTQMDVCEANGVRCIDVRGIDGTNVSKMSVEQAREYKKQMDDRGFSVPCIGSPIGKIKMDDDFAEHLELLKHCFDVAHAFGTDQIRMFSFYPSAGKDIAEQRDSVMDRMRQMVAAAEEAGCVLLHENEKGIYGAKPEGVKDLFATIKSESFKGIFDPANYVEEGVAPYDDGWSKGLAELTDYFHIKDKVPGAQTCVPAGEGHGQIRETFTDAKQRGYSGVMTLEPHMKAAGQFSGFSGPDLFAKAVAGLKGLLEEVGMQYQ